MSATRFVRRASATAVASGLAISALVVAAPQVSANGAPNLPNCTPQVIQALTFCSLAPDSRITIVLKGGNGGNGGKGGDGGNGGNGWTGSSSVAGGTGGVGGAGGLGGPGAKVEVTYSNFGSKPIPVILGLGQNANNGLPGLNGAAGASAVQSGSAASGTDGAVGGFAAGGSEDGIANLVIFDPDSPEPSVVEAGVGGPGAAGLPGTGGGAGLSMGFPGANGTNGARGDNGTAGTIRVTPSPRPEKLTIKRLSTTRAEAPVTEIVSVTKLSVKIEVRRGKMEFKSNVKLRGQIAGFKAPEATIRMKFAGQESFSNVATVDISRAGTFNWERTTNRKFYIFVVVDGVRSERVIVDAITRQ